MSDVYQVPQEPRINLALSILVVGYEAPHLIRPQASGCHQIPSERSIQRQVMQRVVSREEGRHAWRWHEGNPFLKGQLQVLARRGRPS